MTLPYSDFHSPHAPSLYCYNPNQWNKKSSPYLAIHGWLDNHASFLPLIRTIPYLNWLAIDLMGHGKSPWIHSHHFYSFQNYICDLSLWIDAHCPEGVHLIGHSLGASIASILGGLYPDKILSLVLIDGLGPLVSDGETMCEQFRQSIEQFKNPRPMKTYDSLETLSMARKKRHHISIESCRELAYHGSLQTPDGSYQWSFDPKLFGLSPFQMTQDVVMTIIQHISAPTLFLRPHEGYPYSIDIMEKRLSLDLTFFFF